MFSYFHWIHDSESAARKRRAICLPGTALASVAGTEGKAPQNGTTTQVHSRAGADDEVSPKTTTTRKRWRRRWDEWSQQRSRADLRVSERAHAKRAGEGALLVINPACPPLAPAPPGTAVAVVDDACDLVLEPGLGETGRGGRAAAGRGMTVLTRYTDSTAAYGFG